MKTLTDEQLMELIRQSDETAFEELFNRYAKDLKRYVTHHLYNKQEAEDMVSNLYISIWHNRENINIPGKIRPFMYVVLKNKMKDIYKHDKVKRTFQNTYTFSLYSPPADSHIHYKDLLTLVKEQLAKLSPAHRKAITTQIINQYESDRHEKSNDLNMSFEAFKTNIRRARIHLKKALVDFLK